MILYVDFALYWFHWNSEIKAGFAAADPHRRTLNPQWIIMESFSNWFSPFSRLSTFRSASLHARMQQTAFSFVATEASLTNPCYVPHLEKNVLHSRWQWKKSRKAFRKEDHFASVTYTLIRSPSRPTFSSLSRSKWHGRRWWSGCQVDVGRQIKPLPFM